MSGRTERERQDREIDSQCPSGRPTGVQRPAGHSKVRLSCLRTSLAIGSALSIGRQESHKSSCLWVFGGMKRRRTNEKRGMTSLKEKRDCRLDLCKLALGACSSHQTAF